MKPKKAGRLKKSRKEKTRSEILKRVRPELYQLRDPQRAVEMQKYMKSQIPFYGIARPVLRGISRKALADYPFLSANVWRKEVWNLWKEARFREEKYIALDLIRHRKAAQFQDLQALKLYEKLIVTGAWWDLVDDISHSVGLVLRAHPVPVTKLMLEWSRDSNFWKRRVSIICQLDFKDETNLVLLYKCIENSMSSKEFFLRKAIGWALRQYAWTDPKEIKSYVRRNKDRLSPLSQREALKNLIRR